MMRQLLQKKVSDIAIIIVILINKVDWHLNLKFSGDFTQGIPNHGWLSKQLSVLARLQPGTLYCLGAQSCVSIVVLLQKEAKISYMVLMFVVQNE